MTQIYTGEITVTQNLFLKLADSEFLKFTKMDMYSSVADVFAEGEDDIIRSAPDKLKENGFYSDILHLRRHDGVYCDVLAVFHTNTEEDEVFTSIELTEIAALVEGKKRYAAYECITDTYLELLSGMILCYDCSAGTLDIYYVSDAKRRIIFSGLFAEWKEMLSQGKIEKEYEEEFEQLCDDIVSAKSNFLHTLKIRGFIGISDSDICSFNCRSIRTPYGSVYVVGCVEAGSPEKMKSIVIDPVNDKDSFLDMLNKRAIVEHAKRMLSIATVKHCFFIIVDLDNFKSVNDVYGHKAGDEVLIRVTKIINENLGKRGIVGRVGGDEILIITDTINEQVELRNMLRSIRTAVEWAYNSEPYHYNVTCSIGVSEFPANGKDFDTLFELADKMLYIAKAKGKNRYIIYTPELHDPLLNKSAEPVEVIQETDFKNDKIGIMYRLVDNYLIRHSYNNEKIYTEIGIGFELSEILIVYENFTNLFQWTPGGVSIDLNTVPHFVPDGSFGELFDKDKTLVLDGLYKLDGKCPEIEKCLSDKGVKSAMFYRLDKMGNFSGYVMFARDKQRQMWSDYEKMALSLAAKVFDITMRD